jgi:AbrB family looped-hinge helix DNA binding protein
MYHAGGITVNELESRLTQKGQVTIPAAIRARLGLKPRDKVVFELDGERVILRPAPSKVLRHFGMATPTQRPEDFHAVREEVERAVAAEVMQET